MLARMGDVWSFLWLGCCSYFDWVQTWLRNGLVFVLIYHGTEWPPLLLMLCEIIYVQQENTKAWLVVPGQVPDVKGCLPLSQQQYTMPMSLLLCKYIISSHFMYQCFPIPYSLPSRSSASLRDASALLASHGFMMWIQNVFTPGPNPFTAPLVAVSLFWRGQLQSKKCSHRGGMVSNLVLGGKPLILSFPVCSVFWFAFWCSWK